MAKIAKITVDTFLGISDITLNELITTVIRVIHERDEAEFVLKQIIDSLPSRRDWLDPDIEKAAKELLKP
jgi:hypothetical protein